MFKKLLVIASILLLLTVALGAIPAHHAHADTCNVTCNDPVATGCASHQYIITSYTFPISGSTWRIRLMGNSAPLTACTNKIWASLILVSGTNKLYPSENMEVTSMSSNKSEFDILSSGTFYSGAYTNMIDNIEDSCAIYRKNPQAVYSTC